MKHHWISAVAVVVLANACSAEHRFVREANQDCAPDGYKCAPQQAAVVSLNVLRAHGERLTVQCELTGALDAAYRAQCDLQIAALLRSLASLWPDRLAAVSMDEIVREDAQTCIDTFISGREAADCEYYYVKVDIPLRWLETR